MSHYGPLLTTHTAPVTGLYPAPMAPQEGQTFEEYWAATAYPQTTTTSPHFLPPPYCATPPRYGTRSTTGSLHQVTPPLTIRVPMSLLQPTTPRELERPDVGTRVEIHTYPENDETLSPRWFGAVVVESTTSSVVVQYDCLSFDELQWPEDAPDLRIVTHDNGSPVMVVVAAPKKKKTTKKRMKPPAPRMPVIDWVAELAKCTIDVSEVRHLMQFLLCQLRAEHAEILTRERSNPMDRCNEERRAAYDEFDAAVFAYDLTHGLVLEGQQTGAPDLVSCENFMAAFLLGKCAKGDKWLPWHCVLGDHERYVLDVVAKLGLTRRDRYILMFLFSGSRDLALFDALLRPLFEADASEEDNELGRLILADPETAFEYNGKIHLRYEAFRATGARMHTTCYSCHPPKTAAGEHFCYYMVDRTKRFVMLGHKAYDIIEDENRRGSDLRRDLEEVLMKAHEVGPTMTKMFLVSTHLLFPELGILDDYCAIGDGADAAFDFLMPGIPARPKAGPRFDIFMKLWDHLENSTEPCVPRFRHMLKWTAEKARQRFPKMNPLVLAIDMTPYDLQVNLCEWRKFRSTVDVRRLLGAGVVSADDITAFLQSNSYWRARKKHEAKLARQKNGAPPRKRRSSSGTRSTRKSPKVVVTPVASPVVVPAVPEQPSGSPFFI